MWGLGKRLDSAAGRTERMDGGSVTGDYEGMADGDMGYGICK